jgi:excisionase family DNA binding protein
MKVRTRKDARLLALEEECLRLVRSLFRALRAARAEGSPRARRAARRPRAQGHAIPEVARLLGVSPQRVYTWVRAGRLKADRTRQPFRVAPEELARFARAHRLTVAPHRTPGLLSIVNDRALREVGS